LSGAASGKRKAAHTNPSFSEWPFLRRRIRMCIVSVGSGARGQSPAIACRRQAAVCKKDIKKGRKNYPKWEKTRKKRRFKYKMGGGARSKGRGYIGLAPDFALKE
jgi:hypothetical protein